MNFLITGGAGFIGSHLVEEILRQKLGKVRVFDNLSSGKESNLAPFTGQIEFIKGDIRDLALMRSACRDIDVISHHAAMTSVPGSVADPIACNEVNVSGTLNVLLAAKDAKVKRVLFASSSAVYGENPETPKRESLVVDPLSPYAASKFAGELYCRIFSRLHGLETVAFRYFNVFGPRQDPRSQYAAVIPKFFEAAYANISPKVFGDGEQTRDFVFVKDVVAANLLAATHPNAPGKVFNVGTGLSLSLNTLLKHLGGLFGRDLAPSYGPPAVGDIKHSLANIEHIQKSLGYSPKTSIEAGLKAIYEAHQSGASL